MSDRAAPRLRAERRAADQAPGLPLRLIVPGWYGAPNVKWLSDIHVAGGPYLGKYPGALVPHAARRDDQRRDEVDGERRHAHAAEVVHRARHQGRQPTTRCSAIVLNDGTPIKSVEVRVDDGPWQPATLDPATKAKYVEAVHLHLERRHAGRAHARVARHRRHRQGAADRPRSSRTRRRSSRTTRSIRGRS